MHMTTVCEIEICLYKDRLSNLFKIIILVFHSHLKLKISLQLFFRLIFVPPYSAPIDIWEVLWIVSVTDFVLRLITILFKLIFVALPQQLLAFQKKVSFIGIFTFQENICLQLTDLHVFIFIQGKYYLFLERSSQFYRTMVPIQHWLYYFSESYSGPSKVFGVILSAAYLIFKVNIF